MVITRVPNSTELEQLFTINIKFMYIFSDNDSCSVHPETLPLNWTLDTNFTLQDNGYTQRPSPCLFLTEFIINKFCKLYECFIAHCTECTPMSGAKKIVIPSFDRHIV
uniref:Uncharacterized protein n=1 Tax=Sphaerodactylus townsendi TaxID=933632 RepID=A0ACB8FZZ5_9SAUR